MPDASSGIYGSNRCGPCPRGALEWEERRYWFNEAEPETGVFNVMDVTAAQWDVQDAIHQDFQTYVGRHTDFSEPGNRTPIAVSTDLHNARLRPRDQWKNFDERWQGRIERPEGPVVAQWKFDTAPLRMSCAAGAARSHRKGVRDAIPVLLLLTCCIMTSVAQPFTLELLDGPKWIIDPPFDPYGDGYIHRARVEVRADGLAAQTIATLDSTTPQTLAEFFSQLDADWRGWDGDRHWRALEGMAIEARHDGGHVVITVTIEPPPVPRRQEGVWSARVVFTLEAGEQLRTVARDLASLLAE